MRYSKYRNKPTIVDGLRFASKREANRWKELCILQKAGKISRLQRQIRYPLVVNGEIVATYIADFVYDENGMEIVEDVKGVRTDVYKLKKKLMWAIHSIGIVET